MNDAERAAIAWARRQLAGHHCTACGRQWITGASVAQLWHACERPSRPPPRIRTIQTVEERNADDGQKWARAIFGEALAATIPEEEQLRRLE